MRGDPCLSPGGPTRPGSDDHERTAAARRFVEIARTRWRDRRWATRRPTGRRAAETVWGPLLTLGALIVIDQLARHGMPVLYPFPVLLFTVVALGVSRRASDRRSSARCSRCSMPCTSSPSPDFRFDTSRAGGYSLLVIGLVAPGIAVLVSRLREDADRGRAAALTRAEAEALDRRVSFLSQASRTLASSLDYEITFRELARQSRADAGRTGARSTPSMSGASRVSSPARTATPRATSTSGRSASTAIAGSPSAVRPAGRSTPVEVDRRAGSGCWRRMRITGSCTAR